MSIKLEPNVTVKRNGDVQHTGTWRVFRDGKLVGYCWKGEKPAITTNARGVFSQSDIHELTAQLGARPKIAEPPQITAQQWRQFIRRVRKR